MSTYTPIASQTLSSAAASVTFSGIPQNYTDLVLVGNGSCSVSSGIGLRFNGDTGSNYSETYLYGNGTSAVSGRNSNQTNVDGMYFHTSTLTSNGIVNIQNYSNTTTNKTILSRSGSSDSITVAYVGLWRNTAAITSITLIPDGGNFASGSTFNLYGIDAQASAQAKATGGSSIYTDGTYWYHIFNQSGTFTPSVALSNVDYLVVAGGGGSGSSLSGGGGAGGMRCTVTATGGGGSLESKLSLLAQSYTVTVGAGGAAGSSGKGSNGSDSVFSSITSTGGGASNNVDDSLTPNSGGSGGGGAPNSSGGGASGGYNGAAGTANQGYAGGRGNGAGGGSNYNGGGGGGAGAVGTAGSQSDNGVYGTGGAGVATSISSSSVTYAGGGGGGNDYASSRTSGGSGGGGLGGNDTTAGTDGTANTGGGAGGAGRTGGGKNGGSGIVIIRYAV